MVMKKNDKKINKKGSLNRILYSPLFTEVIYQHSIRVTLRSLRQLKNIFIGKMHIKMIMLFFWYALLLRAILFLKALITFLTGSHVIDNRFSIMFICN